MSNSFPDADLVSQGLVAIAVRALVAAFFDFASRHLFGDGETSRHPTVAGNICAKGDAVGRGVFFSDGTLNATVLAATTSVAGLID